MRPPTWLLQMHNAPARAVVGMQNLMYGMRLFWQVAWLLERYQVSRLPDCHVDVGVGHFSSMLYVESIRCSIQMCCVSLLTQVQGAFSCMPWRCATGPVKRDTQLLPENVLGAANT